MRVTGHSPWVVLPTLLVVILVGSAVTGRVAAQATNNVQCAQSPVITSGISSGSVPIPDGGSAFQSVNVPAFTGVYVKGLIVTVQVQHQNWGDLALSLTSPGGLQWNLKQANNTGGGSAGGAVDGSFQFFNLDCLESSSLPPASQGGPGPFSTTGASIWTTSGSALGGQWTLQASDSKTGETGTVRGLQVQIVGQQACPTNAPPSGNNVGYASPCGDQAWYPLGTSCPAICANGTFGGSALCNPTTGTWSTSQCTGTPVCGVQMVPTAQATFTAPVSKVSLDLLVTAPNVQGTINIFTISLQGGLGTANCVNQLGASLTAPAPFGTPVTVVCDLGSRSLGQGLYTLNVRADYTGINNCSSGSQLASGTIAVAADPGGGNNTATPPVVTLTPAPPQKLCSQAPGSEYIVTADFPFDVTPATGQSSTFAWEVAGSASSPEFKCTALRTSPSGNQLTGTVRVTCTGRPTALGNFQITATLSVSQAGSAKTTKTATSTATIECCSPNDVTAYSVANICKFCSAPAAYAQGAEPTRMVAGPLSSSCTGTGDVGTVSVSCSNNAISFTIQNSPGSQPGVQFFTSCADPGSTCPAWRTPVASPRQNGLKGPDALGVTTFFVAIPSSSSCRCNNIFWAIKQQGRFAGFCGNSVSQQTRRGPRRRRNSRTNPSG